MRHFYLLLITPFAIFSLTSCVKGKQFFDNNGSIISKTILTDSIGVLNTHFLYDENGKLVRLQQISDPETPQEYNEAVLLQYNNAGKLIRSHSTSYDNLSYYNQQYTYNNTGDTITVQATPNLPGTNAYTYKVVLDRAGRVINVIENSLSQTGLTYYHSYTYNSAGDIAAAYEWQNNNGTKDTTAVTTYTYDSYSNPYRPLSLPYYLVSGNSKVFNLHNVQSYTTGTTSFTWQHNYNGSKVPQRSVLNTSSTPVKYELYYN